MDLTEHYKRWRDDFALVRDLGISYLRYGPAYYRTHLGPGWYDWDFCDDAFAELRRMGITPIVDLCHFGVPDWLGNFQNPEWPNFFAEYAAAFAERYPWVHLYTPVNEIQVTATFSALYGWWNECLVSDRAFVRAVVNLVRASLLAELAILKSTSRAFFVQSESTEYYHPSNPNAEKSADFLNQRRFLSLDLCYANDVRGRVYQRENGIDISDYRWFMEQGARVKRHCIMGNDYYATNEHLVCADGTLQPAGEIFGYYVITRQYFDRYHLPVMHTETNAPLPELAPQWLQKEWANMLRLKADGVPIVGFTWYSLCDQVDWDSQLREQNGHINPLGLYDLQRKLRPVGEAYRAIVATWRDILPVEGLCLCSDGRHSSGT